MICTDKLLKGIKKSSCPQDILRGFSGLIRVYDWRGFNKFKPNPEYMDYIEIEAVKYIQPSSTPEEREDNVTVFSHAVTFLIDNQNDDVLDLLSAYVNIPVIIELQLEEDENKFLRLFESTGAKMKPTVEFHGSKSGMVSVECTHYDPTIREERLPTLSDEPYNKFYYNWYGSSTGIPTTETEIRNLTPTFNNSFALNTGDVNTTFIIAIPSTKNLLSVFDRDALNANLTAIYNLSGTVTNVPDGQGNLVTYKVYAMKISIPYSSNHKHLVTIS